MSGFDTLLIANRGEIAARIARTARAMGYRTVGVYSAADADAPYLDAFDEAVAIGPAAAVSSYLSIGRLIDAARRTAADAVHPGYGFLAESAAFAEACVAAGLVWIGPPSAVLRRMGDKASAKRAMEAAGVRCVPGVAAAGRSDRELAAAARELGMPVLVKAAAGGGGRGMRRVERASDLAAALRESRREAEAAFGSGELLVERALDGVRHVEIQVLFDTHGHGVHLGERDCSAQRRHQKIVEESPSPALDSETSAAIGRRSVEAAGKAGYVGAGTLEYLVAADGSFHFLEMNPRLQVEHPVTELVTGLDLVELQLGVAAGEPLALRQDDVALRGHAIEARLYAEDPDQGFLPQSGTLARWQPGVGEGVRIDHALRSGTRVSPDYDPLLAKIVSCGRDREEARRRLLRAIERTRALGIVTNKAFLLDLLETEVFAAGEVTTDFVERWWGDHAGRSDPPDIVPALAALVLSGAARRALNDAGPGAALPWAITLDGGGRAVEIRGVRVPGALRLDVAGVAHQVELVAIGDGEITYRHDGVRRTTFFAREGDAVWIEAGRSAARYEAVATRAVAAGAAGNDGELRAPMAAQVVAVPVEPGDRVEAGACLVVLRAMKLEHRVVAPRAARVGDVLVEPGEQVAFRQVLLRLEPLEEQRVEAQRVAR
ncbi:MAG TPA: biotin carboxylase N-terminal domain-containing protein [Thermoanaerobaculia bacterium]|nr:biotin carboxylase N-terminal domain-containing protein [Thermoanaerobaculia bacterium]